MALTLTYWWPQVPLPSIQGHTQILEGLWQYLTQGLHSSKEFTTGRAGCVGVMVGEALILQQHLLSVRAGPSSQRSAPGIMNWFDLAAAQDLNSQRLFPGAPRERH